MAENFLSDDEVRARLTSNSATAIPEQQSALSDDEVRAKLGGEQSGGSSILRRGIADPLVGLAKGALVGIPEAGYGLANLATVGMVGRGVDALNKATGAPTASEGFRKANEFFDSMLSPETQAAKQRVNEAQGFIPTAAEYFKNPSTIVQGIAENAPGMLSMAGLGKAGLKVLGKGVLKGDALKEALTLAGGAESVAGKAILKENARRAALGAAIGEGTYSAGQNVTGIMEVQGSDVMTPKQLALAAGSGFITGLISRMSGGLANRLKIADVDVLLQGANTADLGSITKVVTAMLKSAIMEGAVEELPQSAQEMYAMNLALGKEDPWEGVAEASASGWVIGSAMGVGGVAGAKLRMAIHKADPLTKQIEEHMNTLPQQEEEIGGRDNTGTILQDMANQEVTPTVVQPEQIVTPEVQPTQPIAPEPIIETPEIAQPEVTPTPVHESLTPTGQQAITDYLGDNKSGLNIKEAHNPNGSFVYLGKGLGQDIEGTTIPYTEEEHKQYRKLEAQLKGGLITQKQFSEQTKALSEGVLKRGVETTTETPSPITTTPEGTMRVAQNVAPTKIYHFTKNENVNKILSEGFNTTLPPLHGVQAYNKREKYNAEDKLGKDILYFTTDSSRWNKATVYVGEGNGNTDYTYYDYDNQKWVTEKNALKEIDLSPVESSIKENSKVLKLGSYEDYMNFQNQHLQESYPLDQMGAVIEKAKELGYDIVNINHDKAWTRPDGQKTKQGEKDWYSAITGNSGNNDFFILNKDSISLSKQSKNKTTKKVKAPTAITTNEQGSLRVTEPKSQAVPHPSEFHTFNEYATALGYNAPEGMSIGEFAKTNAEQMAQNKTSVSELTGKWNKRGKAEVKASTTNQSIKENKPIVPRYDTQDATTTFDIAKVQDTFEIKNKNGSRITGYLRNQDFPGERNKEDRGELFLTTVNESERRKGIGRTLNEDAIRLMYANGTKTVNLHATSEGGEKIVKNLIRDGFISPPIKISDRGKTEHIIFPKKQKSGVQDLKGNGQYTAPAFPNRSFNIVKGNKGEGWIIQEAYTGLPMPKSNAQKDILKTKQEAIDHINNNFGLTPEQIKYTQEQGMLSDKSIAWNKQRAEQQQKSGVQDEEITQITSDIGQNRGRELPAGTISRSNPMPNDTATINARTAIGKIAKAFGKSVVWVDINDEKEIKFNGLVTSNLPNRIIMNSKSKTPHLIILGHEIFHEMKRESPELYQQFKDYVVQNTTNTPKFKQLLNDVYKKNNLISGDVNTDLMFEELASEFAGEQFVSREFWENMAKTNPTLFEKVIDIARKMINQAVKALGANKNVVGEQYFKDVQTARKMLADVMGEYSKGKLKGEVGEGVKYSAIPYIDDIIDSFTNHTPKSISPEIVSKFRNSFEVAKDDFKPHQEYFSLPWWNAKKDKMWELAFKIFGIDRIERRSQLKAEFAKIAEPFFEYQKTMKQAGKTSTQIKEGQRLISRALISGDALLGQELANLKGQLGAYQKGSPEYNKIAERIDQIQTLNRYSDEELANGFVDEYGNTIKLQKEEIKAYVSVRAALDNMFTKYVDHLAKQDFRQYRRQKWYGVLVRAAGFDLNKSQTETILGEGLKKAALLRARKIQVNIQTVFDAIDGSIEKGVIDQEAMTAGKIYSKIAEKMGKEIGKLEEAVAYVTNETDKAKVRKTTEELLNAYIMTRPSMKKIKDLRNDYKKSVAYFPRVRPEGKMKIKLVKDIYNKEGQKIDERELDMQMFDNQHQGMKIMQSMIDKHGKNGNLPEGVHFTDVERTVKTPEFAFQGVNDINMQKVLDSAIQGIELKEKVFDENGNAIDVQELLRDMGYQAIAAQFQSRGFARRGIHRNPDLVKGYQEEDLQQVLKDYISGMSGIMTKQEAAADFLDLMKEVSKEGKPEKFRAMATYGKNQLRNDTKADRFSSKIRAFMFTYYLAGVVRMVAAQLSQNYVTAIPDEAEYLRNIGQGGLGKAEKDYHIAMKDVIANKWGVKEATNEIETRMLTQMMDTGITLDQYVRQLFGHMQNEFRNKWNKTLDVLAIPMSGMEIFNRKSAALTRFRHAYPEAMKKVGTVVEGEEFTAEDAYNEAFDEARNAVNSTHFAMSKANLPLWAQGEGFGVVAKTLMTFKTFPQNYLLFMADANWKTRLHSLAYVGAFGGLMGLPFMKDLFDWVEKEFGLNFNRSIRQTLRGVGGKHLEDLGVNGIPAMLGANLSASLAIGLPFTESAEQTIGGVYAGQYQKMKRAYQALKRNDYARAAQNIFPEFARAPLMAIEQSKFGKEVFGRPGMAVSPTGEPILNAQGKPLSMTNAQAAFKALGFNPTDYGREQEMNQIIRRQEKWVTEKKANISQTLKFDRLNGDPNALTNAKKATDELKQGIKDRGIQDLVPHFTFTDIVKASKKKPGAKERREARYKREELS